MGSGVRCRDPSERAALAFAPDDTAESRGVLDLLRSVAEIHVWRPLDWPAIVEALA